MTMKKLLELRKKLNAKRPKFVAQDSHKRKEAPTSWRKPKGMGSKMRHGFWGRPSCVNSGYRGPVAVRGLDKRGLQPTLVHNLMEVEAVNAKTQSVIIAKVGNKKKAQLLKACIDKKLTIMNSKNAEAEMKAISDAITARKEAKKASQKRKEVKPKEAPKETKEEPKTKEQQIKEMEKVITQKE